MNRQDLAYAMTEISDDLLLEAEHMEKQGSTTGFRRVVAAVAVAASLAVTVGAAAVGITWNVRETQHEVGGYAQSYYKDNDGILEGEELNYQVPLTRVELSREAMQRLRDMLWRYWQLSQTEEYAQTHDISPQAEFVYWTDDVDSHMEMYLNRYNPTQTVEPSYTSLEQIEELLGITLDVSTELREAARSTKHGIELRVYTGLTVEEVSRGIEEMRFPEPTCVVINYELQGYAGNGQVRGTIVLPLTEAEAQAGLSGGYYSYEKEGPIWQSTETYGSREVCFFGNDPKLGYEGSCRAIYATECGGYILSADIESPDPGRSFPKPTFDTAKDMLLPLLGDSE